MHKKIGRYLFIVLACYLIYTILNSFSLLEFLNIDIIPELTMQQVLKAGMAVLIAGIILVWWNYQLAEWNVFVRKHRKYIEWSTFIFGISAFYKCNDWQSVILGIELMAAYWIISELSCKQYCYFNEKEDVQRNAENYVEKPVIGRTNLTKTQVNTLDQLEKLIDRRSCEDSFNIGLIGEWGSGKTSVTDTLLYEFQNRKKKEKQYFCLKISTLTLNETKNIIDYIKNCFEQLFEIYGISFASGKAAGAFLESLADLIGNSKDGKVFNGFFANAHENYFLDIENERKLFIKQVQKLLYISKRKNIILIIDDADRNDNRDQIMKLLVEFSSIDGLITIVSLDREHDLQIRPGQINEEKNAKEYDYIDKFIHVRVRLERQQHIEYEKNITKQIINEFEHIDKKENVYIAYNGENERVSLFETIKECYTEEIISSNHINSNGAYNLLTELFFYNLKDQEKGFGEYFESLVNEYIYQTKELIPYVQKWLSVKPDNWKTDWLIVQAQWTNSIDDENFDWIQRLYSNSSNLFIALCIEITALKDIRLQPEKLQNEVNSIEDVYDYYMIEKFPISGRTWLNRKEEKVYYGHIQQQKTVGFEKDEFDIINSLIKENEYDIVEQKLKEKLKGTYELYLLAASLIEFMKYMRDVMNNYRRFKMQLREAELMNINYLDYLLNEWGSSQELRENLEQLKQQYSVLDEIEVTWTSIRSFVNYILFENYILRFGDRYTAGELKDSKMYIAHGSKRSVVVLSQKEKGIYKYRFLNSEGTEIVLAEEEQDIVRKKNALIWEN